MIPKIDFLMNMIMLWGQKIKKNQLIKKSLKIYHQCSFIYFNKDLIKRFEKTYEFYSKDSIKFICY